jgi:hypothetical protein
MNLVYYTLGFNEVYLKMLYLSIVSLNKYNTIDVLVLCDEKLYDKCYQTIGDIKNVRIEKSTGCYDAMSSSMKKLEIFKYDISKYEKVLFVDCDILMHKNLNDIFEKITDNKLYAYNEQYQFLWHLLKFHSLRDYTDNETAFLYNNKIRVFNAGLFGFLNNETMKQHFDNIMDMVENYEGEYYYEQSFMNKYFNLKNLTDLTVINNENCIMNFSMLYTNNNVLKFRNIRPSQIGKIIHFSVSTNNPIKKLEDMFSYYEKYLK